MVTILTANSPIEFALGLFIILFVVIFFGGMAFWIISERKDVLYKVYGRDWWKWWRR